MALGPSAVAPPVSPLKWNACDTGFQCATEQAPLDYQDPNGTKISIAVIRHRASDPAHRIGSLFYNPGGPGGEGTVVLPFIYGLFPAAVRARFDIVSFDPRGTGASTAVRCFPRTAAETGFLAHAPNGFPVDAADIAAWDSTNTGFGAACAAQQDPLLSHLSTADVARDLDRLRQAVGDPALSYLGVSYGTFLGATYANLFPGKVRAMVLDGNVDPAAWTGTGGATFLRLGADQASTATLNAFLTQCGAVPVTRCAFSAGSPGLTQAKLQALFARLRQHPVTIGTPPQTYTYAYTVSALIEILYSTAAEPGPLGIGWPAGAELLQQLWAATTALPQVVTGPSAMPSAAPPPSPAAPVPTTPPATASPATVDTYHGPEQDYGVLCPESPNPKDPSVYPELAALAYARSGDVGPYWSWKTEACASWPAAAADGYPGPWNKETANPVLVIGNTGDPATPYQGSVAMSQELAKARLLTVDGYGHTELLNKSACADGYESGYLLTGGLPPAGTVCTQDGTPFPAPH